MLTCRSGAASAGGRGGMWGVPPALAMPGWAVLKCLMDLVLVLLQHLQSRPSMLSIATAS